MNLFNWITKIYSFLQNKIKTLLHFLSYIVLIGAKIASCIIGIYQGLTIGLLLAKLPLIFNKEDKHNEYINNLADSMTRVNNYIKRCIIHLINFILFTIKRVYPYVKNNAKVIWGYIFAIVLILYFEASFESKIINYIFDNNIFFSKYTTYFEHNKYSQILFILLSIASLYDLSKKYIRKHRFNGNHLFALTWIVYFFIKYRLQNKFIYSIFYGKIAYIDIICTIGILYISIDVINVLQRLIFNYSASNKKTNNKPILDDSPLGEGDEDIFDYDEDVNKIVEQIKILPSNKVFSFAVLGQWGAGKSSFLYLIEKELKREKFEIIKFNPRSCQSSSKIQEEFFSLLACTLSKYDSSCNSTLKDYMSALQIIDNRPAVDKLMNLYKLWDKEGIKDKINNSLKRLCRKVIIIIDDFDRLTDVEILEVLKLIDNNAAFNNIVFITAFDKQQVKKALGEKYSSKNSDFIDKFFNIEQTVPYRPNTYLLNYLTTQISSFLYFTKEERKTINTYISYYCNTITSQLTTLRDIKRFINQIYLNYELVKGDVNSQDFFFINLIKYKDLELYNDLYNKKHLTKYTENVLIDDQLWLNNNKDKVQDEEMSYILHILFPDKDGRKTSCYKRIYETQSFENYFINKIYGKLRIKDMKRCFEVDRETAFDMLRGWFSGSEHKDISAYLRNIDPLQLESKEKFLRYSEMITFLATLPPLNNMFWLFIKIISNDFYNSINTKFNINTEKYKQTLLSIIFDKKNDYNHYTARSLHVKYSLGELDENNQLIKDSDIYPIIKKTFIEIANVPHVNHFMKRDWLYNCIDHFNDQRIAILDQDCIKAYKKYIMNEPAEFIKDFVMLEQISTSTDFNSIICRPFMDQLFPTHKGLYKFLKRCKKHKVDGAIRAVNFWKLYSANDYQSLPFENQGNVQSKIDNDLTIETKKLKQLKEISKKVNDIYSTYTETKEMNLESISQLKDFLFEIKEIDLRIQYSNDLRVTIEGLINVTNQSLLTSK